MHTNLCVASCISCVRRILSNFFSFKYMTTTTTTTTKHILSLSFQFFFLDFCRCFILFHFICLLSLTFLCLLMAHIVLLFSPLWLPASFAVWILSLFFAKCSLFYRKFDTTNNKTKQNETDNIPTNPFEASSNASTNDYLSRHESLEIMPINEMTVYSVGSCWNLESSKNVNEKIRAKTK